MQKMGYIINLNAIPELEFLDFLIGYMHIHFQKLVLIEQASEAFALHYITLNWQKLLSRVQTNN